MTGQTTDNSNGPASAPPAENSNQTDYQTMYTSLLGEINAGNYLKKEVYTGLQQTHQKEVEAHKETKKILTAAEARLAELQGKLDSVSVSTNDIAAKKADAETKLAAAETVMTRYKLIMKDFPELAPWEADGLLPNATPEKLPEVLKSISERLKTTSQSNHEENIAGASALQSSNSGNITIATLDVLQKEMNSALLAGNVALYEEKRAAYMTEKAKVPKK